MNNALFSTKSMNFSFQKEKIRLNITVYITTNSFRLLILLYLRISDQREMLKVFEIGVVYIIDRFRRIKRLVFGQLKLTVKFLKSK